MEQLTVDQWRERILAGWEKWGTGDPLDPRTVDRLAMEFAKPISIPMRPLQFNSDAPLAGVPYWPGFGSVWNR